MKYFLSIISVIFALIFISCSENADESFSLPSVDTSSFASDTGFYFPEKTDALTLYSVLLEKYGLGASVINATYTHTETATLNGTKYSNTVTKIIKKVYLYQQKDSSQSVYSFHVQLTTEEGEILHYQYKWQYSNTNAWENDKLQGSLTVLF